MDTKDQPTPGSAADTAADTARMPTLRLRRDTVHDFDAVLSSQGHSLWTCDETALGGGPGQAAPR